MKAMVLAAGFGTRLGEIGKSTPKCLMTAGGKTLLEHVVDNLKRAGVTSLVINLHHLAEKVRSYVEAQNRFGLAVEFSEELPEILGTGGGVLHASSLLRDTEHFFVHNADIYSELDLRQLYQQHVASASVATLAVMQRSGSRQLLFNEGGRLVGWESPENRQPTLPARELTRLAFSGVQVLSSRIFSFMEGERGSFSIIKSYLAAAARGERVSAYRMDSVYWLDAGTPEKIGQLDHRLRENASKEGR